MSEMDRLQKGFVSYEYKEITVESNRASLLLDGYECFGWEIDENLQGNGGVSNINDQGKMRLRLKRNRKIINKVELTRLQRNFEAFFREIEALENAKTSVATIYALIVGIIGTILMAGSVFAITAQPPHILLCILLAIPAFLGWILPYFLYKKMVDIQTERLTPLIEEKYDEIYEICEKGNKLLM
jgi:hypothetical protein